MDWLEYLGWPKASLSEIRALGYAYIREGKYDISLELFKIAVIFSNQEVYDLEMLGSLYLEMGKNIEALHFLDRALQKNPTNFNTQLNRAKALFALGYSKQAISQTKTLLLSSQKDMIEKAQSLLLSYT